MTRTTTADLLLQIRLRRDALFLAGRDPQGVAPTPPEQSSTWVVTQVEPVLMAMPVGGVAVSVEATDAVKGVRVGHRTRRPLPFRSRSRSRTRAWTCSRESACVRVSCSPRPTLP